MAGEGGLRKQNHFAKSKQPIKSLNYQPKKKSQFSYEPNKKN